MKNKKNYFLYLIISLTLYSSSSIYAMEPIGEANMSNEDGISNKNKKSLRSQITKLQTMYNQLNQNSVTLSQDERTDKVQLQRIIQRIIRTAREMYLGLIPIDVDFIKRKTKNIKTSVPNFL